MQDHARVVNALHLVANDRELIQQLLEDVGELEEPFRAGIPKPHVLRTRFAPILRRWIAGEALFYNAQRLILPTQVGFAITSSPQSIKLCETGVFEHWMEVLYFGTVGIAASQIAKKFLGSDGRPTVSLGDNVNVEPVSQKASVFFDQKMFFWKGQFYTRADVIKMHANALGGVHLDFRRAQDETYINEIQNYLGFEIDGNNRQILIGEDIARGRADPRRRQSVYDATELVAMDTARIFANGLRAAERAFIALLS